jgi:molybdate transport system substrate-binding protein
MLRRSLLALFITAGIIGAPFAAVRADDKPVVTVLAAASLREAFEAAGPAFTKATGYPVRFDFGGSDTLAAQILAGAPGDVFASANDKQMLRVAAAVGTPVTLARNHLVVIVPKNDATVATIADLGKPGVHLVLADPTVPVGAYARATFTALAGVAGYGSDFAARVTANVISEEIDVKAVAAKVGLGEADAGVVYATDVTPQLAQLVRVLRFPPGTAPQARYPIAVLKAATTLEGATAFVRFMTSPAGLEFLKARGFEE